MDIVWQVWKWLRWPIFIVVAAFVVLIVWRIPGYNSDQKSKETVAQIHAQKLTIQDVDGSNLPPQPDSQLVDATVEGIDANDNGIRDDVELAIFKKYPNSPYTRAAELQYAMALQIFLASVSNADTWSAATQSKGRAYGCIFEATPGTVSNITQRTDEVERLVFNSKERQQRLSMTESYRTSFSVLRGADCDVDVALLRN